MNYDTVWQTIRYGLIAIGSFVVGMKWVESADWVELMKHVETIGASGVALATVLWGWYVKWNTTPVPDPVIEARSVPVVDSATGAIKK